MSSDPFKINITFKYLLMRDAAIEVRTKSLMMFIYEPLHTNGKLLDDSLDVFYNSSVRKTGSS